MAIGSGSAKGLAGVHKRAEELASQRQSFGLRKFTPEIRWDGSKSAAENAVCLRILGDDIIVPTKMHRGVPLPENKYFFGVCRHADPINAEYCYVCDVLAEQFDGDAKQKKRNGLVPTDVAVGLAVEMEPVIEGKIFRGTYKVKLAEFQIPEITDGERSGEATAEEKEYRKLLDGLGKPGDKVMIPKFGMIVGTINGQQAIWDFALRRPRISDRVYEISKHGKGLETKWDWNHEGVDRDMEDPTPLLEEFLAKYPVQLPEEWVARSAAEDRYNFFFKLTPDAKGDGEAAATQDDDEDVKVASSNRSALMERLAGKGNSK